MAKKINKKTNKCSRCGKFASVDGTHDGECFGSLSHAPTKLASARSAGTVAKANGEAVSVCAEKIWNLEQAVSELPDVAALSSLPVSLAETLFYGCCKLGSFQAAYIRVRERDPKLAAAVRDELHDVALEMFYQ